MTISLDSWVGAVPWMLGAIALLFTATLAGSSRGRRSPLVRDWVYAGCAWACSVTATTLFWLHAPVDATVGSRALFAVALTAGLAQGLLLVVATRHLGRRRETGRSLPTASVVCIAILGIGLATWWLPSPSDAWLAGGRAALVGGALVIAWRSIQGIERTELPRGERFLRIAFGVAIGSHVGTLCATAAVAFNGSSAAWLGLTTALDFLASGTLVVAMVRVITVHERVRRDRSNSALLRSETNLRQLQRLESVATLAGGIAHDYNNLLTAIIGYTDLLCDDLRNQPQPLADVQSIRRAVDRAVVLTRELLAFSRRQKMQLLPFDLNNTLQIMQENVRRTLGDAGRVELNLEDDLPLAQADPAQIELVVINLALNARDASDGVSPVLHLSTRRADNNECRAQAGFDQECAAACIVLEARDEGRGMDETTRERVFDPFFTTKSDTISEEDGLVPGMGLATAYGIVRQCGGDITVESAPGLGTTFRVFLPIATDLQEPPRRPAGGHERILLVEDESEVRHLIVETLRRRGYDVLVAESGVEALLLAEQHTEAIHLLIADVVMPQMTGHALSRAFSDLHPNARTLFISGYSDDELRERGIAVLDEPVLGKPFSSDDLVQEVRSILDLEAAPSTA